MQFAGQRVGLDLKPIGSPINLNLKLTADILPAPEAILLTGISPLLEDGLSEAEFSEIFNRDIAQPGTIFTGFNNIRFDDEFIRYLNYRNFYDAYGWHWQDGSSRWDLLDPIRMTRALRPTGINWPVSDEGKPSNTLARLTEANVLKHAAAHDALSDTLATIEVSRLIKEKQPKLFNWLLDLRSKQAVASFLGENDTFLYTSSHYSSQFLHTTIVLVLALDTSTGSALVYDLRENPDDFLNLTVKELADLWRYDPDSPKPRLPLKTMKLNRCPAVAPLSVLDEESIVRLKIDMAAIQTNHQKLSKDRSEFASKLKKVAAALDKERDARRGAEPHIPLAEERLYDGFISKADSALFEEARNRAPKSDTTAPNFEDKRLSSLYELYRARNYCSKLSAEERSNWQQFVKDKLFSGQPSPYQQYLERLEELENVYKKDPRALTLLSDLKTYGLVH